MSIDFDGLVLGPCMTAFAKPVTVSPVKSQPMVAPYQAQGVWIIENVQIVTDDGGSFPTRTMKLGIQLSEFVVPPIKYDTITSLVSDLPMGYLSDTLNPSASVDFVIDHVDPDGQGGATLFLKRKP